MLGLTGCMGVGQGGMGAVRACVRVHACVCLCACTHRGRGLLCMAAMPLKRQLEIKGLQLTAHVE